MDTLPVELLQACAAHMPVPDLLALRLTCRSMHAALPLADLAHTWDAASLTRYLCMNHLYHAAASDKQPAGPLQVTCLPDVLAREERRLAGVRIVHHLLRADRTPLAWWAACIVGCTDLFFHGSAPTLNVGDTRHEMAQAVRAALGAPQAWPDAAGMDALVCNFWEASQACAQGVPCKELVEGLRAQVDNLEALPALPALGMLNMGLPIMLTFLKDIPDALADILNKSGAQHVAHVAAALIASVRLLLPYFMSYMQNGTTSAGTGGAPMEEGIVGRLLGAQLPVQLAVLWMYRHLTDLPPVCDMAQFTRSASLGKEVINAPPSLAALARLVDPASARMPAEAAGRSDPTHVAPPARRPRRVMRRPPTESMVDNDLIGRGFVSTFMAPGAGFDPAAILNRVVAGVAPHDGAPPGMLASILAADGPDLAAMLAALEDGPD